MSASAYTSSAVLYVAYFSTSLFSYISWAIILQPKPENALITLKPILPVPITPIVRFLNSMPIRPFNPKFCTLTL